MGEFAIKNNIFALNGKVKQQVEGTAVGTKFALPYAYIYMDEVETKFLRLLYQIIARMNLTNI